MRRFKKLLLNLLLFPVLGGFAVEGDAVDDFDQFFAEATQGAAPSVEGEKPEATAEPSDEEKAEQERLEAEKAAAEKAEQEKAEAEKAAAEKAEAEKAKADQERIDAQAREAVEKAAKEKAEQEAANRPDPEEAARLADKKAKDEQFRKEWPDHAAVLDEQAARIAGLEKMVQETLARVDPLVAVTQAELDQKHEAAILAAHADAFDIYPEVVEWIKTQPDYLQTAYNNVLDNGSAPQVIGFLNDFKAATGKIVDTAEQERLAAEKAATEKAEREKALHLAPVGSRRSNVTSGAVDPDDFDGAFAAAARDIQKQQKAA